MEDLENWHPSSKTPVSMADTGGRIRKQVVMKRQWKRWILMASLIEEAATYRQFDRPHTQNCFPGAWVTSTQVARGRLPRQQSPIKGWPILRSESGRVTFRFLQCDSCSVTPLLPICPETHLTWRLDPFGESTRHSATLFCVCPMNDPPFRSDYLDADTCHT